MSDCSEGTKELNRIVTILYISIQISIALFISYIGAVHVRRCRNEQDQIVQKLETEIAITSNAGIHY